MPHEKLAYSFMAIFKTFLLEIRHYVNNEGVKSSTPILSVVPYGVYYISQ